MRPGQLSGHYPSAVVLVVCALTPYLILTTALGPLREAIADDVGLSLRQMELAFGMSAAAYAVGTVVAAQAQIRLPPRMLLIGYAAAFVLGSVLAAWAPTGGVFMAGHIIQGLTTGLLLIAAVPPLVLAFGSEKLSKTAVVMNLGIFGAVALGPVIGGLLAGASAWQPLLWATVAVGVATLALTILTYQDQPPTEPDGPIDVIGVSLAAAGCAGVFFGVSELRGRSPLDVIVLLPFLVGLVALVGLVVYSATRRDPLIPIRKLGHTVPVAAIVIAMAAGAGSVSFVQLAEAALDERGLSQVHAALLFWPEFGAALLTAAIFGLLFFTRWMALMPFAGMVLLAAGGVVLTGAASGGDAIVVVGSGLVGLGVGASVAPALFLAGWSLKADNLPRVFAFVELLRAVAAFLVGPVLIRLVAAIGGAEGVRAATWVAFGIVAAGLAVSVLVAAVGRPRLEAPDIDPWLAGEKPAFPSGPLAERLRG